MLDVVVYVHIYHVAISTGTTLRPLGLSEDQMFIFGLQFCSGNSLFIYFTKNSLGWIF